MTQAEEVTARTLILALLYRYASLAREESDHAAMAALFEPEGKIHFPDGRSLHPSQLGEITQANRPKYLRHHLTTIDIQFDSPEEARCLSYVVAASDQKMPDHWGQWTDVVVRQADGTWLFREKVVNVGGRDPEGWLASVMPSG